MDEGEHNEADAFDFNDYVFIFFHSLHVSFVSFKGASGHFYALVCLEVGFVEYLASGGVG